MNVKEDRGFYGYEGYSVIRIYEDIFLNVNDPWAHPTPTIYEMGDMASTMYSVQPGDLSPDGYFNIRIREHPELLDKAKKVYTHPSCTLPRESLAKKYKRCTSAMQADVVVIPTPSVEARIWCTNTVVFVDEENKRLLYCQFGNAWRGVGTEKIAAYNRILHFPKGTPLHEIVHPNVMERFKNNYPEARFAEAGYYGEFTARNRYLVDYMEMLLPANKIVFQETLTKSLNDETNKSSFETFMSIHDMLTSTDQEIRNVGLKTLATMDYTNFKNSAICVLRRTESHWKNDYKTRNSTGVKYMMKILGITYPSERSIWYKDTHIRKEDYEIIEKLWTEFNVGKGYMRNVPFLRYDTNYKQVPRLMPDDNQ